MWKSNERVPGSWLSHLSSPGRNCGAWQLLHFPPSRPNGAGKFKDFVGSSYVKLRCFFINSNPNRQIRTQQWSFIKYNYDALISFPDVTLLNLFPSQNRLLVVPIRGEEKAIFTWGIPPDMYGSLGSPIFSKFNRKWKLLLDKDRKNLQVYFFQGVDPILPLAR